MPLASEKHVDPTPSPMSNVERKAGVGRMVRRARKKARRAARRARSRTIRLLGGKPTSLKRARSGISASGMVENLDGREILGWVHVATHSGPVRVGLYVNDLEVDHAEPGPTKDRKAKGEIRSFRFKLKEHLEVRRAGGSGHCPPRRGSSDERPGDVLRAETGLFSVVGVAGQVARWLRHRIERSAQKRSADRGRPAGEAQQLKHDTWRQRRRRRGRPSRPTIFR